MRLGHTTRITTGGPDRRTGLNRRTGPVSSRRVMRDTRPLGDLRQPKAWIAAMSGHCWYQTGMHIHAAGCAITRLKPWCAASAWTRS